MKKARENYERSVVEIKSYLRIKTLCQKKRKEVSQKDISEGAQGTKDLKKEG